MANYQYLESTGVIVPDTSTILTEVQGEYKSVFGSDLVVTPDTPQGVLVTAEALARSSVINNNAALANQINPNNSGGVFLDAIGALTGARRVTQTQTVVADVALAGVAGTVVPEGSLAATSVGDQFRSNGAVTLDAAGEGVVSFTAVQYGPIPCAAHALTNIAAGGALGWETVDNDNAGVLGSTTQADPAFRAFRNNTLAFNGLSLIEAATSALFATPGVQSLWAQENTTSNTITMNAIVMVPHSYYFCINGGTNLAVAAALLENKSSGAAWNGGTTVNLTEPASDQVYTVSFDRPEEVGILVRVTTPNGDATAITNAVLDYANGVLNNIQGFVVGSDVSPFEIAGGIMAELPGTFISKVEISLVSPVDYTTEDIAIAVDQIAHTQLSYISVVII